MAINDGDHFAGRPPVDEEEPRCDICGRPQNDSPNTLSYEADWNGETGNHTSCEINLAAGRQQVIAEMIEDEANFVDGTLTSLLFKYHKWMEEHTDTFDPVVVRVTMDAADEAKGELDRESLKLDDDIIKAQILGFMRSE